MTDNIIEQLKAIKQYCKKHRCSECEIRDFCDKYFCIEREDLNDVLSSDRNTLPMAWEIVISKPLEKEE